MITKRLESTKVLITKVQEEIEDDKPWYYDLKNFLMNQSFPEFATSEDKKRIRRYAIKCTVLGGLVYQNSFDGIHLCCLDDLETWTIIEQAHSGICGGHVNGQMLAKKILIIGYYWPTLNEDCSIFVRTCIKCQLYANNIHAPASALHSIQSP